LSRLKNQTNKKNTYQVSQSGQTKVQLVYWVAKLVISAEKLLTETSKYQQNQRRLL